MIAAAPQIGDYLTDAAATDFETVQAGLRVLGIDFEIAPRLVRGLDYYTGTTFEFQADSLDAAQNAIGGGGRYDGLVEQMGGKRTPGIGFGIGIERVLIVCEAEGVFGASATSLDVFVIDAVGGLASVALLAELRAVGLSADRAYGNRSMKKQWGAADRVGARWGVMLAPRESAQGNVVVKDLVSGEQADVKRDDVAQWLRTREDMAST
jgi:histidyl-tRNA synthetase